MFFCRSCYSCRDVAERYRLPDVYVRPGQVCCVAPGEMWFYRVVIRRLLSATEVEVYYVDFGDLTVVSRNRLQFLKSVLYNACVITCFLRNEHKPPKILKPSMFTWFTDKVSFVFQI